MGSTVTITRLVVETKRISRDEAKKYIVEARINVPGELDLYCKCNGSDMLQRVATIPLPDRNLDDEDLLLYARENMPDEIDVTG